MVFQFVIDDRLTELARHAQLHWEHFRTCYTNRKLRGPALLLVKDQGVYLMSCFTHKKAPPEARLTTSHNGKDKLVICYAVGHDPKKDEDWWVGGDDFGLDLEALPAFVLAHYGKVLSVNLGTELVSFSVHVPSPKNPPKQEEKP